MNWKKNGVWILLVVSLKLFSQNSYQVIDNKMEKIPTSETKSTVSIAQYIQKNFKTDRDKVRALFYFCTHFIQYDVDNMFAVNFNETSENKIRKALDTKKGVCIHYAEVFNQVLMHLQVEGYVIEGITKQYGKNDVLSHAWNAAKIEGNWYLFDPTWGSGFVYQGKFIRKMDNAYFMVQPASFIKSHYPFDYVWQFSSRPQKANDFLYSKSSTSTQKFDYDSAIATMKSQSEMENLSASIQRMEENGMSNGLIFDRYSYLKSYAATLQLNNIVRDYNEAVNAYNDYIHFKNQQFQPAIVDSSLLWMILKPKKLIESALANMKSMKHKEPYNEAQITQMQKSLIDLESVVQEQIVFVREYIDSKPAKRKSMFYKRRIGLF